MILHEISGIRTSTEELTSEQLNKFQKQTCCRMGCNHTFNWHDKKELYFVLCSNGDIRWWCVVPEEPKKRQAGRKFILKPNGKKCIVCRSELTGNKVYFCNKNCALIDRRT